MNFNKFNIGDRVNSKEYGLKNGVIVGFKFHTNEDSIYDTDTDNIEEYLDLMISVDYDIAWFDDGTFFRDTFSEEYLD